MSMSRYQKWFFINRTLELSHFSQLSHCMRGVVERGWARRKVATGKIHDELATRPQGTGLWLLTMWQDQGKVKDWPKWQPGNFTGKTGRKAFCFPPEIRQEDLFWRLNWVGGAKCARKMSSGLWQGEGMTLAIGPHTNTNIDRLDLSQIGGGRKQKCLKCLK